MKRYNWNERKENNNKKERNLYWDYEERVDFS